MKPTKYEDNDGQPLDIIIPGQPITKGSYKPIMKNGKALADDPRAHRWELVLRLNAVDALNRAGFKPYDCPVAISCMICMPCTDDRHYYPCMQTAKDKGGGDLDKLCRAIGDGLQVVNSRYAGRVRGGVLTNDSRIVGWDVCKMYETELHPMGVYLTIWPLTGDNETIFHINHVWKPATKQGWQLFHEKPGHRNHPNCSEPSASSPTSSTMSPPHSPSSRARRSRRNTMGKRKHGRQQLEHQRQKNRRKRLPRNPIPTTMSNDVKEQ